MSEVRRIVGNIVRAAVVLSANPALRLIGLAMVGSTYVDSTTRARALERAIERERVADLEELIAERDAQKARADEAEEALEDIEDRLRFLESACPGSDAEAFAKWDLAAWRTGRILNAGTRPTETPPPGTEDVSA